MNLESLIEVCRSALLDPPPSCRLSPRPGQEPHEDRHDGDQQPPGQPVSGLVLPITNAM